MSLEYDMRCGDFIPRPFLKFFFYFFFFRYLGRARGFERIIGVCAGVHGFLFTFTFSCPFFLSLPVLKPYQWTYHEPNPR